MVCLLWVGNSLVASKWGLGCCTAKHDKRIARDKLRNTSPKLKHTPIQQPLIDMLTFIQILYLPETRMKNATNYATNYLIVNLAVSELVTVCTTMVMTFYIALIYPKRMDYLNQVFATVICKFFIAFLDVFCHSLAMLSLTVIAFDRFFGVRQFNAKDLKERDDECYVLRISALAGKRLCITTFEVTEVLAMIPNTYYAINPVIYFLFSKDYRRGFIAIIKPLVSLCHHHPFPGLASDVMSVRNTTSNAHDNGVQSLSLQTLDRI
ncbi:predicted protein [Nematostella vectensis]|uniref:G-protein coupled receptors family 1 profile domain-containing protein n=1 Tax=Nematostella vectensis TaxID=45351 RepID=A7SL70_NEMVE|nr:predicted protein [Nematostella vectensis]|eukprot:XP_001627652.1 predicted protein [Nematostella vectensis]